MAGLFSKTVAAELGLFVNFMGYKDASPTGLLQMKKAE
jgi:hypothetical protein